MGDVYVFYGSELGITTQGAQRFNQDSDGIAGVDELGDAFGLSLNSGDLNGDGYDELVISAPYEDFKTRLNGGAVHVLPGSLNGIDPFSSYTIHMYKPGFNSPPQGYSTNFGSRFFLYYGEVTSIVDIDNDGEEDLIVPTPTHAHVFKERSPGDQHRDWRHSSSGAIHFLPSGRLNQAQWINSKVINREPARNRAFASSYIKEGDFNNDGNLDFIFRFRRFKQEDEEGRPPFSLHILFGNGSIPTPEDEF